jgi:hypothetical protein
MSITSSSTAAATISGAAWCGMWPTPLSIISFADGNVAAKTRALISGDTIVSRSPMIITVGVRHGDATRRQRNGGDNPRPPRCRRIGDSDIFRMGRIGARHDGRANQGQRACSLASDRLYRPPSQREERPDAAIPDLTRHAPDDGQEPHRLAAYGTEEVIVAEVRGGHCREVTAASTPEVDLDGPPVREIFKLQLLTQSRHSDQARSILMA